MRLEQWLVARLGERGPGREVGPPALERAVVVVAQDARRFREHRPVAGLELRVPRVGRQPAEHVRPEHRADHRPVAAARLPGDPTVVTRRQRPVAASTNCDHLVAQVRVVAPGRVESRYWLPPYEVQQSTNTTIAGAARPRRTIPCEQRIDVLRGRRAEGGSVPPHVDLAGHPLDQVDRRITSARGVVVARRQVDPDRPHRRVTERVPPEGRAVDRELVEATAERPGPGTHR